MAKPRSNIAKGRAEQKRILQRFAEAFGLTEDDARCAIGAETGCDIKFSSTARERIGLSIEIKNVSKINLWAALEQAVRNTLPGTEPALIIHRSVPGNTMRWLIVPLDHYLLVRGKTCQKTKLPPSEPSGRS